MRTSFYRREIVFTEDGSHSIYLPELDEHYHSSHGALRESLHVFIRHGLDEKARENSGEISILEMGFGTGLNAWLALCWSLRENCPLRYETLEAYPVDPSAALELNYTAQASATDEERSLFASLHHAAWNTETEIVPGFRFAKRETTLEDFQTAQQYDLIFYDAFAPRVQPELWTTAVFEKLFAQLKHGGILVTYCAKGEVKRNMKAAGFSVEALPGPPGKREMTRARKA